ncbi:MAG: hypothetical protein ABIY38_11445, partial [Rhodococcus sp. (in: high G+C Gram-positive bacteria)]
PFDGATVVVRPIYAYNDAALVGRRYFFGLQGSPFVESSAIDESGPLLLTRTEDKVLTAPGTSSPTVASGLPKSMNYSSFEDRSPYTRRRQTFTVMSTYNGLWTQQRRSPGLEEKEHRNARPDCNFEPARFDT